MNTTRRKFLKTTFATASMAACGLAKRSDAKGTSSHPLIDTHVYLGHWPHQTLADNTPDALRAALQRDNITQAWVGSFDALFHKDIAGVNQRLAEACRRPSAGKLVAFGTVNPTLPDWEDDVRRCHETFHMPGVRVHPNYHGYNLDDPRFARLLDLANNRGLIVQIVAGMDNKKHLWLNPRTPAVDLHPLANSVGELPDLKLIIAGGVDLVVDGLAGELAQRKNAYFDFAVPTETNANAGEPAGLSRRDGVPAAAGPGGSLTAPTSLKGLIDQVPVNRVLFGSCAPLHPVEAALSQLEHVDLNENTRRAIEYRNAEQLLTMK